MHGSAPPSPAEQLRLALLDLQQANRDFVERYGDPAKADLAAHVADEARTQASRWASILRAANKLEE